MKKLSVYTVLIWLLLLIVPIFANAEVGAMTLPSSVKIIEKEAFYGVAALDKVVIPEGTTEIHSLAFVGCSLTEVVLPSTLTYIASDAFDVNADMAVTAPENSYAFNRCVELGLIEGADVEETPEEHFTYEVIDDTYCRVTGYAGTATNVVIPRVLDGYYVKEIGWGAFEDCTSLKSVTIPAHVTEISQYAFSGCTALTEVNLPDGLLEIHRYAFEHCDNLVSIHLPDSITGLGCQAFYDCDKLANVNYPKSWETINTDGYGGSSPFDECESLKSIVVPEGVTAIPSDAFAGCTGLTSISLPQTLTEISWRAFEDCTSLKGVTIPAHVTEIQQYAFSGCIALTEVNLPDGLLEIHRYAFEHCDNLVSIHLPDSITGLGCQAFYDCDKLANVNYPKSWETINTDGYGGSSPFDECESLRSIVVPEGVTAIPSDAFAGCTGLTSISLPQTLTEISWRAFEDCTSLKGVTIPAHVTEIQQYAFSGCIALTEVNLPDGLLEIHRYAFEHCDNLVSIHLPDSITGLGCQAFYDCDKLASVNYPKSWETINTDGYGGSSPFDECESLRSIIVPEGVTAIPSDAFAGCTGLTSITIPECVKTIGYDTFEDCPNLTIYGVAGSYAETYANENNIPFNTAPLPVVSLSATTTGNTAGSSITVMVSATNGTAPYTYRYSLYKNGTQIRQTDYSSATQYSVTLYETGSYQIVVDAKDRIGSVGTAYSATYAIGEAAYTTISGKVLLADGMPVEALVVFIYGVDEDSSSAYITETDENGYWSYDNAIVGHQYCIKYAYDAYTITPAEVTVTAQVGTTLTATAAVAQSGDCTGTITFAMTDGVNAITEVPTGKSVVFNIQAANATRARLIVDGIVYESFYVGNGTATFERAFTQDGLRSIAFQAGDESGWGEISAVQMLNVTATGGQLDAPTFITAANQTFTYGSDVIISWNSVANASAYRLFLYCNDFLIWRSEEMTAETSYTFRAAELPAVGKYACNVIATGYGYTQAESSLSFELVGKTYKVLLNLPEYSEDYVVGDTFHISVSNPDGAYVLVEVITPEGETILLPQTGASTDAAITIDYEPTSVGAYTIQAHAFEMANMIVTELATSSSTVSTLTVAGTKLTNVCIGTGYGNMFTTDAVSAEAVTNNAVEYVEVYEGETLLVTMSEYTEENFSRTFTAPLNVPTSGLHSYVFKAYDVDGGNNGTRKFTFYAVKPCVQKTVYSQQHDVRLLKYPVSDSETLPAPVYVTDALTLLGTYDNYSYVQFGTNKGYIATSLIADSQTYTIPGLELTLKAPENNSKDYLGHALTVRWDCNIAISDAMKYTVVVTPTANPINIKRFEASGSSATVITNFLYRGNNTFRVELTNQDGSVVYGTSNAVTVFFFATYEEYLEDLNYNPYDFWISLFMRKLNVVRNSQKMFTTGAILDDGTVAKFDLESLTNGGMKTAVSIATGDYGASTDDINVVKALSIAHMIAEQYGSSNGMLDLGLLKDLLSWVGLPEDFMLDVIFPREYHDGAWYVRLDLDAYKKYAKNHAVAKKLNKTSEWLSYGQALVNVFNGYSLYTSVDSDVLIDIANRFDATGDATLGYVADYLRMMSTPQGALLLSTMIQGADIGQEKLSELVSKGGWTIAKKLVKNTHLAAFLVGAKLGAKVGQTFNKTFLNIDGIYSAAFATGNYVDAAEAYWPYVERMARNFESTPEEYHQDFYLTIQLYGKLVAGSYKSCGDIYAQIDKAWVESFWNWVTNQSGNEKTINTCNMMASMMGTYFDIDYEGFLDAVGLSRSESLFANKGLSITRLVQQPTDQCVQVGQRATFSLLATGDNLTYQWYINRNDGDGWCKLKSADNTAYVTSATGLDNEGYQYRCAVTDAYGNTITSDIAILHVSLELPNTGDESAPLLWSAVCALSALGIVFILKKRAFK